MRLRPAVCEFYASVCNRVLVSIGKQASKGALKTVDEEEKMLDKSNFFVDTAKTKTFPTSKKMKDRKKYLTRAREDYLEAVLILSERYASIRPIDLAKFMEVSKATVSVTLAALCSAGYLYYDKRKAIKFTPKGRQAAESVLKKHNILFQFLTSNLGIPRSAAQDDASKMEHSIDLDMAEKLSNFIERLGAQTAS